MKADFSIEAWRGYCKAHVEIANQKQEVIMERLLSDAAAVKAWKSLANSVKPLNFLNEQGIAYQICWQEALHNLIPVLFGLCLPANSPNKDDFLRLKKAAQKVIDILEECKSKGKYFLAFDGTTLGHGLEELIYSCELGTRGMLPIPLQPGKRSTALAERNYMALYLRERVIKPFFDKPHNEDIARLVNVALNLYKNGDILSEAGVRNLRAYKP